MTSLLFVNVLFGSILHILIEQPRYCLFGAVIAIVVFLTSFVIVSTHRRRHIASETGFTESKSGFRFINRMQFITDSEFRIHESGFNCRISAVYEQV